jgi:hypothetical protein
MGIFGGSDFAAAMPPIDPKLVFSVLGPLFLLLAAGQWWRGGRLRPSGRAWLRIGLIFLLVAAWLWWSRRGG